MILLSGKELAAQIKIDLRDEMHEDIHLLIIKVGNDPASDVYVRNKAKACEQAGIMCTVLTFDQNVSQQTLADHIVRANQDDSIHGILVQLPLPRHIDTQKIISLINPLKDVDGFHVQNVGKLVVGQDGFVPCTPLGILGLLDYYETPIEGKHCVIVGRSNIVGKPMAALMLERDATVTICHSYTQNLKDICKQADILICAIGKPNYFNHEYVKEGAIVIDVGINRDESGKLCGDVDFEDVKDIVSAISPVPGGVGVMTVATLLVNCFHARYFQRQAKQQEVL